LEFKTKKNTEITDGFGPNDTFPRSPKDLTVEWLNKTLSSISLLPQGVSVESKNKKIKK
jgi:hypothetical protein